MKKLTLPSELSGSQAIALAAEHPHGIYIQFTDASALKSFRARVTKALSDADRRYSKEIADAAPDALITTPLELGVTCRTLSPRRLWLGRQTPQALGIERIDILTKPLTEKE